MSQRTNWTQERANLQRLCDEGRSTVYIGNLYGVSKQRIYQVLTKYGINTPLQKRKNSLRDKEPKYFWLNKRLVQKRVPSVERNRILDNLTVPDRCPMLGLELEYEGTGIQGWSRVGASPSIDQINPGDGYVLENIQIISWRANRIKNDSTVEELGKIYNYMRNLTK